MNAHTARAPRAQVTHLFRDVLHGWGQLLLCVNVSPTARDYDETARVLRYAAVAAQVGTAARAQPPLRPLRRGSRALFGIGCQWKRVLAKGQGLSGTCKFCM